jgi:hypothetical protein
MGVTAPFVYDVQLQAHYAGLTPLFSDVEVCLMRCVLTFSTQLTMTPEKTNFITQGYDGLRRLKAGPMLDSYRGLNIIHSRQYSLETGAPPRDLLRRRTRVAE